MDYVMNDVLIENEEVNEENEANAMKAYADMMKKYKEDGDNE